MSVYDNSPEALHQHRRTQRRIANWAEDTAQCSSKYQSPFMPRSDVPDNNFYNTRSPSSSRSPTPGSGHSSKHSSRSNSRAHQSAHKPGVRSPLRSQTIHVDSTVSPNDSISQVSGPSHRSHRRARSHSPTRHHSSSSRSSRSHHRSHHHPAVTYAPAPQYSNMQYVAQYPQFGTQYTSPPPVQYADPRYVQASVGGYTLVYPKDSKVSIVYPQQPTHEHHSSGGLLRRIFGSQSGKHERSRSLSVSRR